MEEEKNLDPKDWDAFRKLGHQMVDDAFQYLQNVGERPTWRATPEVSRKFFESPLPRSPLEVQSVYEEFKTHIQPYPVGNVHPRFWGWAQGSGTPLGALAEFCAAAMNSNSWGGDQSPVHLEKQVIDWMKEAIGFPAQASGLLVSGGSMANLLGLAVARKAKIPYDVAQEGMDQHQRPFRVYCSSETHNSIARAAEVLGIGRKNVVSIAAGKDGRIDVSLLRTSIGEDRKQGRVPLCVVGTAGTVGFGEAKKFKSYSIRASPAPLGPSWGVLSREGYA